MDDRDLQLLREFRLDEAEPPPHLQGRIEEQLWQAILDEEAAAAGSRRRRAGGWRQAAWLRPLVAAGAAASLALGVAVVSDGGVGSVGGATTSVTQAGSAGVFDGTANALFGQDSSSGAPIVGSVDLTTGDDDGDELVGGPSHDSTGALDADSGEFARSVTRDPAELRDLVRESIRNLGIDDADDHAAYRATMRWVVDPAVPVDLRAAMLRSLSGLQLVDPASVGFDVLGRRGIVIGHLDLDTGVRTQAVLDPDSGTLLEVRSFTTTYVDPACEPGTFTEHAAYEDGMQIDPSSLPWADWPAVVAACGDVSG